MAAEEAKRKLAAAGNNRGTRDDLERRRWMKNSLGALGALGLGALALSGDEMPKREGAASPATHPTQHWREEPVYIFPREAGQWLVDPGHKLISRGQVVTWKALGYSQKVTLLLPEPVFDPSIVTIGPGNNVGISKVKATAPSGLHGYQVVCDGQLAIGGSHPGVIVDP